MKFGNKFYTHASKRANSWNANALLIFSSVFLSFQLLAQPIANFAFEYDPTVMVKNGTVPLKNPWAGGINYGQFSALDYDYDGDDDLVVFDRSADEFVLFENQNGTYIYLFQSQNSFPKDVRYRCAFIDYNNDGKNDLFTYGIGGLKVYKNSGNSGIGIQWTLAKDIVETNYLGSLTNLYVSSADIPAITDVDLDGDIDVLTFQLGGERVEYHQNQSMELYGIPDSLVFELKNECWGHFREDPNNNAVFLNNTQSPCGTGNIPNPERPENTTEKGEKHSGSTLLAIDMNGNGVKDLILGDVSSSGMTLLMNGGTAVNTDSPMISQDNNFPSNTVPVQLQLFPAPFYVDVDFDGIKDLIVAPNARTVSENQKSVLFYKNMGTNTSPNFNFQTNAFLQNEMIDHGFGSIPLLVDQNGDGKKDLLVANFFRYKATLNKETGLLAYRNTGTATVPEYTFFNSDYLGFTSQNYGLRLIPTFGDLDGDGDQDLILGKEDGGLLKFTNTAGAGTPMAFAAPVVLNDNTNIPISVQSYSAPQLIDLNKDGLLDLVVGKKTGELSYYQNTGNSTSPQFTFISSNLGGVDIASTPDGYSVPHFFSVNDTTYLFVGAYDGQLHYYNKIDNHLHPDSLFTLVNDKYLGIDVGLYSSFWVDDIDNDGALNLFIGQDLGGVTHLEANLNSSASLPENNISPNFYVVPNPAQNTIRIKAVNSISEIESIRIVNLLGQEMSYSLLTENQLDISNLPAGSYLVSILNNGKYETVRFIKL